MKDCCNRADAVLVAEPTGLRPAGAHMGSYAARITAEGRSVHGNLKQEGVNAIEKMLPIINACYKLGEKWEQRSFGLLPAPVFSVVSLSAGDGSITLPGVCTAVINFTYLPDGYEYEEEFSDILHSCEKAEELLFKEFQKISSDAYKLEFTFEGWGVTETSSWLRMTAPRELDLDTYLFLGSGNGAFSGELRLIGYNIVWNMYYWDRYGVFRDGKLVAYVSGRPKGRLISQTLIEGNSELPHLIVDEKTNHMIKELLEKGEKVIVEGETGTYTKKDMRGCDLVLPLRAEAPEAGKIIICAHYDTMYNTKGAFDNGSGAVIITEIAKLLSKGKLRKDIDFILMDAEECRLEGAKAYASCKDLSDVDYLINVDGAGR